MAYIISSGITSDGIILTNDSMTVLDGGTANSTTIQSRGRLDVYSGGTANSTTVKRIGGFYVSSGGVANSTTVNSGGGMIVSSGGKVTGQMTFESGAIVSASNGATLDFDLTGASAGDAALVNDLSLVQGTPTYTLTVDGTQENGTYNLAMGAAGFNSTISVVNTDDEVLGTLVLGETITTESASYTLTLSDNALFVSVNLIAPGPVVISGTVISSGSATTVNDGEIYKSTRILSGYLYVSSGGIANDTTIFDDCYLIVFNGGTVTSSVLFRNGNLIVSSGGTANNTSISPKKALRQGGVLSVCYGGKANNTLVDSRGTMLVSTGGVANSTTVDSCGTLHVSNGGITNDIIVSSGGTTYVSHGGKLTGNMTFENGAVVSAYTGASLDFNLIGVSAGSEALVNNLSLVQGTPTYYLTVDGTQENGDYILAEGAIGFDSPILIVENKGWTGSVMLYVGKTLTIFNTDYTLSLSDGSLILSIFEPVITSGVVVADGTRVVSSGELYQETFVDSGGILEIASGGRTKYTQIGSSSYDYYYDYYDQPALGEEIVSSGGYAEGTVAINGTQTVYGLASGTVLSGMEYWDYYYYYEPMYVLGHQDIMSGGTAITTRISSGAQGVGSSGLAIDTVMFYGSQYIASGGIAQNTWINSGIQYVANGGVASGNVIRGGWHYVSAGGSVYQETISSGYQYFSGYGDDIDIINGYISIAPTASVQNIQLHSGASMYVSGGSVTNLVQESGGRVIIDFRGNGFIQGSNQYNTISLNNRIASGFVYYAGAIQNVESGGTMLDPVLFSGAIMNVRSTGMVSGGIVAANGYMYVSKGASVSNTTINSDGCVIVAEGSATGVTVLKGGNVVADFNAHIAGTSDGSAFSIQATNTTEDFIVLSGYTQIVDQGKTALWTKVKAGGCQVASSGGTATGTEISYGGSQFVSLGATANGAVIHGGYQYINSGTIVSDTVIYSGVQVVYSGAVACNTIVSGGRQGLSYGASAIGTVLINGNQSISSGAVAENTTIRENGLQWLGNDNVYGYYDSTYPASAKNTHVSQGGTQRILYLGLADGTVISSGGTLVLSCGSAVNVQHLSGGVLSIDLSETYFYDDMMGYESFSSYAFASGTNVKGDFSVVSGTATNLILYEHASLYVGYGMSAIGTTISSGGILSVQKGGTVLSADIEAGGQLFCSAGGSFVSGHVASGGLLMVSGTHVSGITLDKGAEVRLDFGGEITGTSDGQSFYSSCSNVISNFEIESGYTQTVWSGYRTEKSHIHSGGVLYVSSGGTATDILQDSGGVLSAYFESNGANTVIGGTNESGTFMVSGGVASNLMLYSSSYLRLASGMVLSSSMIQGGSIYTEGNVTVSDIIIDSGCLYLSFWGNGAGLLRNISIGSGGIAYIGPNSTIGGNIQVGGDLVFSGTILAENDTNITVFVAKDRKGFLRYLSSLSSISNSNTSFSIDVESGLNGRYSLAWMLPKSLPTFQFLVDGTLQGNIALDQSVFYNGVRYTLTQNNSYLYLDITANVTEESVQLISGENVSYCGPVANDMRIVVGETQLVKKDGSAVNTLVDFGGTQDIESGGLANRTTVMSGGQLYVRTGANAISASIQAGGSAEISQGGSASFLNVMGGGMAEAAGTVDCAEISESGLLHLAGGAVLAGTITVSGRLTADSVISANGTRLMLNLNKETACLNQLDSFAGAYIVLHVSADETGTFKISDAAPVDNMTLSVSGMSLSTATGEAVYRNNYRYQFVSNADGLNLEIKEVHTDFEVSDFIAPTAFVTGETASFSWNLTNNGEMPVDGVRQSLYLVNADNPNRKTLLKSVYLTDLPGFGETAAQTMDLTWNDTMGYANSLFQVVVEADGDVQPDDNTAVSASQYHFEQKLSIEKLPDSFTENTGRIRVVARRTGSPDEALSAQIVLTDASGLVSTPQTVTFAAGESEKVFYLTVGNNAEYQGNADIQVGLQAQGYEGYLQSVTLTDDELPSLSFAVTAEELTEGDTFTAFGKVQLDHALDHDLRVKLAYDKTQLSGIPDYVVIKAGETEAAFALTVIDDATAEIDKTVKLTATADGVKSGTASLLIHDNDVPAIALSVNKTVVSEGDGVYALVGTITRTDNSTNYVKVKFADVDNSGLILPSTVTLGTGAQSVNFYIGIVDNALVDGDRTATVKANIYIDSCGCTVIPISGETQVSFTILDNDGEALGLSFDKSNVAENTAGAARLTITRNTVNGDALTVNLSVTGSSLLDLPDTVQFEAGQNSVTIDVNTLTDGVNTGNQMAVVTASAEGYASAAGYLNISDVDLPDFVISEVSPAETHAYAGKTTLVNLTLANSGFQAYSGKVNVKLSLSNGTELGTYKVNGPFEVGETKQVGFYVNLPEITGTQTILAEVDPDNLISELNDGNNTAFSASFKVKLDYIVTVETEPEVLYTKAPITVTGSTKRMDGTAIGNMPVEVLLKAATGEKLLKTTSDAEGNYALTVDPSDLYAGSYSVYAGNLGSYGAAQDRVEIAGMKVNQSRTAFTWDVENRSTTEGSFTVSNLSGVALSGVTIHAVNAPDNFVFVSDGPAALDANGQLTVNYTITAAGETEGGGYELTYGWQKIDFVAESDEGVTTEFSGYFYSNPQIAVLTLSETKDVRTLYSGKESFYEFQITNTGFGDTGEIHLNLPENDLIKIISNPVIENLAYGESTTVTLKINPTALGNSIDFNAPYSGNIGITAENADSTSFAFDYTFITNDKGNITITLTDEWTQYAVDHPMLSGAKVGVYNAYTEKLVTTGYTDENGSVSFSDLAEGKYILKYSADGHNNAQEVVTVRGGETLERNTFLHVSTVKYDWVVRPVELTDTYEIVLSTEFQTNVPSPVVTIEGPTELPELAWGESTLMNFTVTNHGLIAAQDFTLNLSELQMGYEWEVLNDQPVDIAPNSSVNYTVKLKRGITSISTAPAQAVEYAYDEAGNAIGMKSTIDGITTVCDFDGAILSQTDGETIVNFFYDDEKNPTYLEKSDSSGECHTRYDCAGNLISSSISGMTLFFSNGMISDIHVENTNNYNCVYDENKQLISFDLESVRYHLTWEDGVVTELDSVDISSVSIGDESNSYWDSTFEFENRDIFDKVKIYQFDQQTGGWNEIGHRAGQQSIDEELETIVIVHGLNNKYDDPWITDLAKNCSTTGNYQIISVCWDEWSSLGESLAKKFLLFDKDVKYPSAYLAATAWAANYLLDDIKGNVKTVIGHSYGAHIGGLLSKYLGNVDKLIALDPAEESTIMRQKYSSRIGWDISKYPEQEWGRESSARVVEVYKSSSVFGGGVEGDGDIQQNYGHYNYLLSRTGDFEITVKGNLGKYTWDDNIFTVLFSINHGRACDWLVDMVKEQGTIGGWYNAFVSESNNWVGVINSETNQLECVTANLNLKDTKQIEKNPRWSNYTIGNPDWHRAVRKHAVYVDFSLKDEDVRSDLSDKLNKVKLYKCNDTYTLCVPVANLANNATISIDTLESFQEQQGNSLFVYLGNDASGPLVGKAEFQMPASSLEIVPVVLTIDEDDLSNFQNINLFIKVGVNDKGEYIDYELDSSNNTRDLTVEVEEINCTAKLLGMWYLVCEGEIVDSREEWLKTPYCCDFNYTTSSPLYYKSGSSELFDSILRLLGGSRKVLPAIMTTPKVVSTNSHCQWIYVPASASATPDGGMMSVAAVMTDSEGDGELESICAHVMMEFKQTAVMSREGFEGTLTLTNEAATEMTNIMFTATVLNSAGEDVSDLFEILPNGADGFSITQNGALEEYGLGNKGTGTFTVLYVPGRYTSTEGPEDYQFTGTISYTDSLVGDVSIDLTPITLTVNPSPSLQLHYFVERDVYADDPFTDAIEKSIPAEISVLVVNAGKGDAWNFSLSGLTPEIVDNQKGLLLNYTMTDAAMNGVKNDNGIVDVNFGTVAANSSAVAQWWYETNVQGHYSDYSVNFTQMDYSYVDLYGNTRYVAAANRPDVSLIESADIHELIRSVQCGDDELPDFLVDDLADDGDTPDTLYLSTGAVEDVNAVSAAVSNGTFGTNDVTITLTADFAEGWNYLRILDPGNGDYELTGIIRDGEALNVRNSWQTDRYYLDELGVKYENRLHLLDYAEQAGTVEYTLTYTARDKNPLAVMSITGADAVVKNAVGSLTVTFNKAVNASSFTWADLELFRQGDLANDLITDAVTVTQINSTTFEIGNLGELTVADGYYQLIVRTDGITDTVGNAGSDGKALTWTMASAVPAVASISGIDDVMNTKADSIEITFTASVNAATLMPAVFLFNGASSNDLVIKPVGESNTKFTVSGISGLLTEGGNVLEIDLTQVAGINGNTGLQTCRKEWMIDLTAPAVQEISESLGVSGAAPSELVFEATEDVTVNADALTLKRDGVAIASDSMNVAIDGKKIIVTGINVLSDGAYELELALDKIADAAGNTGSGTAVKKWTIDKSAPAQLAGFSLAASCDLGESDSDARTSTRDLTLVGTLPEAGLRVRIYQQTGTRGRILLRELTPDGTALETAVKVQGGHSTLIVELMDAAGNTSETSLSVFVDELAVSAEFQEKFEEVLTESPQSITFVLSEEVVGLTAANFTLSIDGENVPLDGMSIVQTDALTYVLRGITASANGAYTLSLDMTGLVKKSTGLACSGVQSTGWSIYHADPPTIVSTSINSEQMLDGLATFSIVFSAAMNCDELIESGAIIQAVRIMEVDSDNNVVRFITLSGDDFQYIQDTNTLVWNSVAPLSEGGNYRLVLDTGMLKSDEGVSLAGSNAESGHSYQASEPSEVSAQTQDGGYSVPVWYDYNGDGKLDLLVGEKATDTTGRIRVLLNTGTTETPVFGDYTYLPGTDGDWTIAASNCLGVAPRFADVNGDGVDDLVYGTSDGRIEYALKSNGVFGTGMSLLADGTAIDVGNRAVFDLVDWNGDGHLDIVSGAQDGRIYLFVNNGNWTFSAAQTLSIQLESGWSAPAVADLDGDGDLDVVSGDAKGNLYRFLNNGDGTLAVVDIAAGESDRSRPFICDVNGDGILDITVGYKSGQVSVLYGEKGSVVAEDFHINSSPVFSGTPSAKVEDYQVTLSWEPASDDIGVAGYKVRIGDTEYQTTGTTLTLADVDVGTYSYQVGAVDEAGLEGWSSLSTFEVKDVTPPVLNGLPSGKVWKNSVRFSWESASDNVAVAGYRIELNGQTYDTSLTVQFISGLELGDYEYRVGAIDTSGLITWSEKQSFTVTELADTLDHVLMETVPTANYGPGCVASSIGMLLGYYDKYGYCGFDVSDLIQGEIELESRNKADALMNTFIATPGYTSRFVGQSESAERPYTLTEQNELNTAAWDSLADWLGTGQKWRGNEDYATAYYYGSLDDVKESQDTYSVSGTALPVKFADFKYGLNLFVESVNYKLDGELTRIVKADTAANGTFSFADYTAEIDAGRGVLISLASPGNLGHMVLGYGYNEATGEIIFDDTTESGRRMVWNGTYQYAGHEYHIQSITTVVLDTESLNIFDKTPPVITLTGDNSTPLQQTTLTATVDDGSDIYYSTDNVIWTAYTEPITVTDNVTYYFKATDAAGNVGNAEFTFGNIDTTAPEAPTVFTDIVEPTNKTVTVTATFSEDSVTKEYSLDGQTWKPYIEAIKFTENGSVSFRGTDDAGNISEVTSFAVSNIDKLAPVKPVASANITMATNGDVLVSAQFSEDSIVKEYSLDGQNWKTYVEPVKFTENGDIFFRGKDAAGNISEVASYTVSNIVKSTETISGVVLINESRSVMSGQTYVDTVVSSGGTMIVSSGGIANNTTVNSRGQFVVCSGGTANSTTVNSSGFFYISSGGIANSATVNEGGRLDVLSGGTANVITVGDTTLPYGGPLVFSSWLNVFGTANDITVYSGGQVHISDEGMANNTVLSGGFVIVGQNGSNGVVNNTVIHHAALQLKNGGQANSTTCSAGSFEILAGGIASNTIVSSSGKVFLYSGGTANNTTVNESGSMTISSGGTATAITEKGGYVEIQDGADVTFTPNTISGLILSSASATVHSGTTATNFNVNRGGYIYVYSGGIANNTTVNSRGSMFVSSGGIVNSTMVNERDNFLFISSGGMANDTTIISFGRMHISSGGTANNTTLNGGFLVVFSNGTANNTTVTVGGNMCVSSGGSATNIIENGGYVECSMNNVTFVSNTFSGLTLSRTSATVHSGTTATDTEVNSAGNLYVYGGVTNRATINSGGRLELVDGIVNDTAVNKGGIIDMIRYGTANSITVNSGGRLMIRRYCKVTGRMVFEDDAIISAQKNAIIDFNISELTPEAGARVNNLSVIQGTPIYTLTVSETQTSGVYTLAEGMAEFGGTITVINSETGSELGTVAVGETLTVGYDSYTLNLTDSVLTVTVDVPDLTPTEPTGTAEKVSWESTGAKGYIVEYSTDNFEHVILISVVTNGNAIDTPDLPAGTYQWRVKADANSDWAVGEAVVSDNTSDAPKVVQSNEDGNDDLFFASPNGTWGGIYYAQHVGSVNDWTGTNEIISAAGKGRIQNLFFGSSDPNVLCLTDGENGDAIFVDDVFTELPEEIEENTARLYRIQKIRAGAGDDIVDMTSQRFEYVGDGLTIRGGEGNDTIWANKGDNRLFGDAGDDRIVGASGNDVITGGIGNDRMHGGGGDDVFTFCDNWGTDNVEQLETGKVTLWFASGDESKWNAETLTYMDGDNSVTVKGVASVTLKFGNDGSEQYAALASAGAFAEFTSQKIFEEAGKGLLA